jgi:methyl coenzyme M reductase subunit C
LCVAAAGGGGHGGPVPRGTTAAAMVGVCVMYVTLPRHITKPAYFSVLYVF